jgi:hypothetical protein
MPVRAGRDHRGSRPRCDTGRTGGALALLGLLAVGGYLAWAYRTNHYDDHGCPIRYLYSDSGYPLHYKEEQVGKDIPAEVAARHPDQIYGREPT